MNQFLDDLYFILENQTGWFISQDVAHFHLGISRKFLQKLTEAGVFTTIGRENKLYFKWQLNAWAKKNRIVNALRY